ncbi:MAG: electron transfer flavoprotein subunit beta/FixA family protein [Nitrososphaerales archaeon]
MNLVVLLKQVVSSDVEFEISEDGKELNFKKVSYVINEADDYALEAALRLKELTKGYVTVISLGPMRVREALYIAMAKGADKAIHISIEEKLLYSLDPSSVAKILSKAISKTPYEIILTGSESFDYAASQVGVLVAESLGIPHISVVSGIEVLNGAIKVKRELGEGFNAELLINPPALLTIQYGIYSLRYAPVFKILNAKKRSIMTLHLQDLGLSIEEIKPKTRIIQYFAPPKGRKARYITGSPNEIAKNLIKELREAKVV